MSNKPGRPKKDNTIKVVSYSPRFFVKYLEANDASGKYRWWTHAMEEVGQFSHANSIEEIIQKARLLVVIGLHNAEYDESDKLEYVWDWTTLAASDMSSIMR